MIHEYYTNLNVLFEFPCSAIVSYIHVILYLLLFPDICKSTMEV